jgi:transposase InsO family protein
MTRPCMLIVMPAHISYRYALDAISNPFIDKLDNYLRWYNEKRIKMSLGAMSPVDYRRSIGLAA